MNTNDWPNIVPPPLIENSSQHTHDVKIMRGVEKTTPDFSGQNWPIIPNVTGQVQNTTKFQPGVSGNPSGRPKGARNKFSEIFLKTLADDFASNGADALSKLRTKDPEVYFRIIIALLPKSLVLKYEESCNVDFDNITEEEFIQMLNKLRRQKIMESAYNTIVRT